MKNGKGTQFVDKYMPSNDAVVELVNGKFVDVIGGKYFPEGTKVVIQGNKIKAIPGIAGEPANLKPDYTIDLKGRTVIPGMFNTHSHTSWLNLSLSPSMSDVKLAGKYKPLQLDKNMADCLSHGVTCVRDCANTDLKFYRNMRNRIEKAEIPGPCIYQSVIVGPVNSYLSPDLTFVYRMFQKGLGAPVLKYDDRDSGSVVFPVDANEQKVRDAVNRAIDERGAHYIKIGEQRESLPEMKPILNVMTPAQLEALTDQARKRGIRTTMHHMSVESFRRAAKHGVSSLAHIPFQVPTQVDIDEFKRSGCILEPTYSTSFGMFWRAVLKGTDLYDRPDLVRLSEYKKMAWSDNVEEFYIAELHDALNKTYRDLSVGPTKMMGLMSSKPFWKYFCTAAAGIADSFPTLWNAGVKMACGNDAGVTPFSPASIKYEVSMFDFTLNSQQGGLNFTGADALRLTTIDSAIALGLQDSRGSIKSGKIADLAVIEGDPLTNLKLLGNAVSALFYEGKLRINNCGLSVEHAVT